MQTLKSALNINKKSVALGDDKQACVCDTDHLMPSVLLPLSLYLWYYNLNDMRVVALCMRAFMYVYIYHIL